MLRQRQHEKKNKKLETRVEGSTSSIKSGMSATMHAASGDSQDPVLSRRRSASPLLSSSRSSAQASQGEAPKMDLQNKSRRSQWIFLAVTSGACAAFNGVFAKLYVASSRCSLFHDTFLCIHGGKDISRGLTENEVEGEEEEVLFQYFGQLVQLLILADIFPRTTTELTTSFATSIANLVGLGNAEKFVEVIVRAVSSIDL
jgi:hypothetical protein